MAIKLAECATGVPFPADLSGCAARIVECWRIRQFFEPSDRSAGYEPQASWTEERTLKAEDVAAAIEIINCDHERSTHSLRIRGWRITGSLDLRGETIRFPMLIENCYFEKPILLHNASTKTISLRGCNIPELLASSITIDGSLNLDVTVKDPDRLNYEDEPILDEPIANDPHTECFIPPKRQSHKAKSEGSNRDPQHPWAGIKFQSRGPISVNLTKISGDLILNHSTLKSKEKRHDKNHLKEGCALIAGGLEANSVWLDNCEKISGRILLSGARLQGILAIRNTTVLAPRNKAKEAIGVAEFQADAISASDIDVRTKVYITDTKVHGRCNLSRARVNGDVRLDGSEFCSIALHARLMDGVSDPKDATYAALYASRADIGGGLFLDRVSADGAVRLQNVRVRGVLSAKRANLRCLKFSCLKIESGKSIADKTTTGVVRASSRGGIVRQLVNYLRPSDDVAARIAKTDSVEKTPPEYDEIAFNADRATVNSFVDLSDDFQAWGAVTIRQATIGGNLNCRAAKFRTATGLEKLPPGEIWHIPKRAEDIGNDEYVAFSASGSEVRGSCYFQESENAGEMRFRGAVIHGNAMFYGGSFSHPKFAQENFAFVSHRPVLNMKASQVRGTIFFTSDRENRGRGRVSSTALRGGLDLYLASCGSLRDSSESWPQDPKLKLKPKRADSRYWIRLDGFHYSRISVADPSADRENWLRLSISEDNRRSTQPYEQLAKVLRAQGLESEARRYLWLGERTRLIRRYRDRRWHEWIVDSLKSLRNLSSPTKYLAVLLNLVVLCTKYLAFHPNIGLLPFLILWIGCGFFYRELDSVDLIRPADAEILVSTGYMEKGEIPQELTFRPFLYSLDLLLPLDLGMEKHWAPASRADVPLNGEEAKWLADLTNVGVPLWVRAIEMVLGWLVTATTIIGFSGLVRPEGSRE